MKRIALVFLLAILLPALLLAGLAVRSLRDQELVVNSQRVQLHQTACDAMVTSVNLFMDDIRGFYGEVVDEMLKNDSDDVLDQYDTKLRNTWSQIGLGAVVSDDGKIISPPPGPGKRITRFYGNHAEFLSSKRVVEVYQAPQRIASQLQVVEDGAMAESIPSVSSARETEALEDAAADAPVSLAKNAGADRETEIAAAMEPPQRRKVQAAPDKVLGNRFGGNQSIQFNAPEGIKEESPAPASSVSPRAPGTNAGSGTPGALPVAGNRQRESLPQSVRNVAPKEAWTYSPTQELAPVAPAQQVMIDNYSSLNRVEASLNEITSDQDEGAVSRIINGELHVLLWKKHPAQPGFTFWAELNMDEIKADLADLFSTRQKSLQNEEVSLVLLDAGGEPVARSVPGFSTDWSVPFVASEVGQILPRWEVAAYLVNPDALNQSAKTVRFTLLLTTLVLLGAVAAGGILIMRAVNYEMTLATRKTDFVSNVSHELKTPLTSIRMFSELLEKNQNPDAEQTRQYSGVISKESARLSRLINRLLDFSRLDRGEMKLNPEPINLVPFLKGIVETYRMQIEAEGLALHLSIPSDPVPPIEGDVDALSQVFANLLSNAEKYAAAGGEIEMELRSNGDDSVLIEVKDRGKAISKANQRRIFEKFYRIDESINSGIEGSGIGLALCRQIIELHGGEIRYSRRDGGGSVFSVELPVTH